MWGNCDNNRRNSLCELRRSCLIISEQESTAKTKRIAEKKRKARNVKKADAVTAERSAPQKETGETL
tara:strand:+ start:720 stop:920 length:201 start_codon:yes stop_codon:yes gene_type:complete